MKIFAYEHITGGGFIDAPLPDSLRAEGELMLRSLVRDLVALPDVRVEVMCDHRIDLADVPAACHLVHDRDEWRARYVESVATCDAVWPIAPETGGVLEQLSRAVLAAGRVLLNSTPDAVRLTTSKRATAQALAAADIAAIPAFRPGDVCPLKAGWWVVKPDDGCGCEDNHLCDDFEAAIAWISAQPDPTRYVLQPYIAGEAASLCVLARDGVAWLLSVNRQRIAQHDDRLQFLGSIVNSLSDPDGRYRRLAERVVAAVPGLWGYVGVDLVIADSGPVVVEINPRLTTSYVGLSAALDCNAAALVLALCAHGEPPVPPRRRAHSVEVDVGELRSHA
jgi:tyramine---L-glutamate ligase